MPRLRSPRFAVLFAVFLVACEPLDDYSTAPRETYLYMDVHEFGHGKVTMADVARAHAADLNVQGRYGVQFLQYWVDEFLGKVYCLSRAPSADAVVETHRQAHGLIPTSVGQVDEGQ